MATTAVKNKKGVKFMKINVLIKGGLALLLCLLCLAPAWADDVQYGSIAVKGGKPVTPSPAPASLPTNLLFFTSGTPVPTDTGLGPDAIKASGKDVDASYKVCNTDIVKGKTITVLALKPDLYSRTNQGINQTSGKTESMTFPGGSPKAYILDETNFAPWYKDEVPLAPAGFSVTLEGYSAGSFKPIIKVSDIKKNDPNHEVASYACEINIKGAAADAPALDSGAPVAGEWRPVSSKLLDSSKDRTYVLKVKAGNYKGLGPALSQELLVPAPVGGTTALSVILTLQPGLNTFSLGIPSTDTGKWYAQLGNAATTEIVTINDLIAKIGTAEVSTVGYVKAGKSGEVLGAKRVGDNWVQNPSGFLDGKLSATQGYQIFIKGAAAISLTIKNSQ